MIRDEDLLLEWSSDRMYVGMDNLAILVWAQEWALPQKNSNE